MSQESKAVLISLLGSKTVSYKAEFAKALGSVPAAVMLSQAFFWQENARFKTERVKIGDEVYFAKTSKEWEEETGLSKDQQHTARKVLVAAGMMKEIKYGMPAVMHFRMDVDATVDGITRYSKTGSIYDGKPVAQLTANPRTSGGRFRRIEDGNPDATIIESLNSIDSKGGEANETTTAPTLIIDGVLIEEKKEGKESSPVAPAPSFSVQPEPAPSAPPVDRKREIDIESSPRAKTPTSLRAAMLEFFIQYPLEWSDGIMQLAKGGKFPKERRDEIVTDWCCHAVKENKGGNTYAMLNADLQKWFRNQDRADSWAKPRESQHKPKQTADERFIANLNRTLASIDVEQFR